jgi:hypothetical protein
LSVLFNEATISFTETLYTYGLKPFLVTRWFDKAIDGAVDALIVDLCRTGYKAPFGVIPILGDAYPIDWVCPIRPTLLALSKLFCISVNG